MKKSILFLFIIAFANVAAAQSLKPFRSINRLWGYKDAKGNIVVQPKYEFGAKEFKEGMAIVWNSGLKGYGVIDATGKEVVAPQYTSIYSYSNGLAEVCRGGTDIYGSNGKWGFIDTKGNDVIPVKYDRIYGDFEGDSYAQVTLNKKTVTIDKTGREVTYPSCDELVGTFYRSKTAVAKKNGKYGLIDKTGKVIIPFEYDGLFNESEGLLAAKKGSELYGFIDLKNNRVIQPEYVFGGSFQNGVASMRKNNLYGVIDKKGNIIVPFQYDNAYPQITNAPWILTVKKDRKVGLLNFKTGALMAPVKYDEIADFSGGVAVMKIGNKYGLVSDAGKEVLPPTYDYASSIIDGFAFVRQNGKYGFIDNTGKVVIPVKYDYAGEFQGGIAGVTEGNDRYFIDKKGERVVK